MFSLFSFANIEKKRVRFNLSLVLVLAGIEEAWASVGVEKLWTSRIQKRRTFKLGSGSTTNHSYNLSIIILSIVSLRVVVGCCHFVDFHYLGHKMT